MVKVKKGPVRVQVQNEIEGNDDAAIAARYMRTNELLKKEGLNGGFSSLISWLCEHDKSLGKLRDAGDTSPVIVEGVKGEVIVFLASEFVYLRAHVVGEAKKLYALEIHLKDIPRSLNIIAEYAVLETLAKLGSKPTQNPQEEPET